MKANINISDVQFSILRIQVICCAMASEQPIGPASAFDPEFTQRVMQWMRPALRAYHRCEVHGIERVPKGPALVVSNHSGGLFALDTVIFAADFYAHFGYERPMLTLSHDMLLSGPQGSVLRRVGFIPARPASAQAGLAAGGVVVVFPGGDYDAYRPTAARNTIDFAGRMGYVRTAIKAGIPIVPMVSIGGQETQIFVSRGTGLARLLRVDKAMRVKILPVSVGFPFGLSVLPVNVPLPAKITTQILDPIDLGSFGSQPDPADIDHHVRTVMQEALDGLATRRRFPVLG